MAKVDLNSGKQVLKQKSRNKILSFDKLQMYFGEPYVIDLEGIDGSITVYQPTIGNIVKFGEKRFYTTLNIFVTNTTSYRLMLWEFGIDWNEISDFDLFTMLYTSIDPDASKLIFGDLDWTKFQLYQKKIDDETSVKVLYDAENHIEINEDVYQQFCQYLRNCFNIFPEEKITTDKTMKSWYINKDKRQKANEEEKAKEGKEEQSSMLSVISACVNHPGFKYNLEQLKDIGVCQFYDSVKRLQVYESTTACMKGMYSGFVDAKNISPDTYNFMKDI